MKWMRWIVNAAQSVVLISMLVGVKPSAGIRYALFFVACAVGCFYLWMAFRCARGKDLRGVAINSIIAVIDALVAIALIWDAP